MSLCGQGQRDMGVNPSHRSPPYPKGDVVVVDSEYDPNTYRVHIGDYHVIVSTNSLTKKYRDENVSTGSGQTIQTGPRGGKYYINSNGNKTYIKSKK